MEDGTTRHVVAIRGSSAVFAATGKLEADLKEVIDSQTPVLFTVAESITMNQSWLASLFSPGTRDVGAFYRGAATLLPSRSESGKLEVIVDPEDIRDRMSEAPKPTGGEAVAHELLGHALGVIRTGTKNLNTTNRLAVQAENEARRRSGAGRGQRTTHKGGFPQ